MEGIFTLAVTLLLLGGINSQILNNIEYVGNKIKASSSGVDVAGSVFLLNDMILTEGVVFAYSAFFRSTKPVRLQIWRPQNVTGKETYQLIAETRVIPAVDHAREDVYIESKLTEKCIRVRSEDRLGVFFEEAPASVAYTFDATDPTALAAILRGNKTDIDLNDVLEFDALTFPYDFSVAAYVHTDISQYNDTDGTDPDFPPCPKGMLIPDYVEPTFAPTTTTPPPTGKPGATGATGPMGAAGPQGPVGEQGMNGTMGEIGATGPQGGNGTDGATGPMGPMGSNGSDGSMGATGPQGIKGDTGIQGPEGPAGPPGKVENVAETGGVISSQIMSNPMFPIGLLIWLFVLTILVIILIILFCVYRRRNNRKDSYYQQNTASESTSTGMAPSKLQANGLEDPEFGPVVRNGDVHVESNYDNNAYRTSRPVSDWMDDDMKTMKEDSETLYSSDTLTLDGVKDNDEEKTPSNSVIVGANADTISQMSDKSRDELVNY